MDFNCKTSARLSRLHAIAFVGIGLLILFGMVGCQGSSSTSGSGATDTVAQVQDTATVGMDYLLPTPEELISSLSDNNFDYKDVPLLDLKIVDKVTLTRYKALYFGIAYADFLYLSYFNKGYKALDYLKVLKTLATELGISNKMNDDYLGRMEKNLTNVDSLKNISIEMSVEVFKNIETLGGQELFSEVGVGTIVEALYLASVSIDDVNKQQELVKQVVDMGLFFDNYRENFAQYSPKDQASIKLMHDLNVIKDGFYSLNNDVEGISVVKRTISDSTAMLTLQEKGAKSTKYSAEKFLQLKKQIQQIRQNIFSQSY